MITSFVIMPELMRAGTSITGSVLSSTDSLVLDRYGVPENLYIGRNFLIPDVQYRKVKLTVQDYSNGIVYAIVGIIFPPESILDFSGNKDSVTEYVRAGRLDLLSTCSFIPLYVTEYLILLEDELTSDINVFNTPSAYSGKTSLYVPGINDLFSSVLGIQRVTSLAAIWNWELRNCDIDVQYIPGDILDDDLDPDFATMSVSRYVSLSELQQDAETGSLLVERCCVRKDRYPQSVKTILKLRSVHQLLPLIDKSYHMHPIARCVDMALSEAGFWYTIINTVDYASPKLKTVNNGAMREALDMVSRLPSCDFRLLCCPVKDYLSSALAGTPLESFNPFTFGTAVTMSPAYIKLCDILREESGYMLNYLSEVELKVVGSYLEDMFIYDSSDELIQYIDLFWWNLAAGDGLFEETILH